MFKESLSLRFQANKFRVWTEKEMERAIQGFIVLFKVKLNEHFADLRKLNKTIKKKLLLISFH